MAIKNAREMALLPYASRVTQTSVAAERGDGERARRRERDRDLPPPDDRAASRGDRTSTRPTLDEVDARATDAAGDRDGRRRRSEA